LIYADDGDKTYYHFNAHGDVVALTNESGNKTKSYSYNAFGVEYNETTLDDNQFRYCGEYYDKETHTIYLRARYYNAEQGRFTQEDPIRDGYNWYAYCGGNSVNCIDPTGCSAAKCDLQSETNPNKFLNFGPSGGGANQYMKVVADAMTVVAGIALTAYVVNSIADNPPLPMNKYIAMEAAKAEAKAEIKTEAKPQEKVEVQERQYYVYVLLNEDTSQVEYVGRTLDPVKRAQAHEKDPNRSHLEMRIIHKNLKLEEARGLEQVEMLYYHTYKAVYESGKNSCNKINGISPKNGNREIYMEAATTYFENIVSNEFYCLEELFGK
jgi:RHS repeat-associated protein